MSEVSRKKVYFPENKNPNIIMPVNFEYDIKIYRTDYVYIELQK